MAGTAASKPYPIIADEDVMRPKAHGTCETPVQSGLRYGCDEKTADRICCFNRHYAEHSGYWKTTQFLREVPRDKPTTFYDSVTGKPLFVAPTGRTFEEFERESAAHGWPSFRDEEVVWENVRCLRNGETVSVDGTHLGHNLPDRKGNRYCINLVSVAGNPKETDSAVSK
jgi:peptide methionine sulfoxide reductase MsrB